MSDISCLQAILSDEFYDFLIDPQRITQSDFPPFACTQSISLTSSCIHISRSDYPQFTPQTVYYSYIPKLYGLMEGTVSDQIRVIPQQLEEIAGLRGQGVLLGFIGTGINYMSPSFRTISGQTRIVEIWDQTIQDGPPPADLSYGTVYTSARINEAINSPDPLSVVPSTDTHGNGTYLASVAAASEITNGVVRGVVPDCSLAIVKLKEAKDYLRNYYALAPDAIAYQENDIMLAMRYLVDLANRKNLPLVICLSLGTNTGAHASNSFLSSYIDEIALQNHCVVCGTGNEAGARHHFLGTLSPDTSSIDVEVRVENNPTGFWMELWGLSPDIYTISVISPSGETVQRIPYQLYGGTEYTFTFERSTLSVAYQVTGRDVGNPVILIRLLRPSNGIWIFRIYNNDPVFGRFHMWLPLQEFLQGSTYFIASTPETTLTEPSSTLRAITTSTYDSGNNSILLESGRGYPVNGTVKPFFASPGVGVPGLTLRDTLIRRNGSGAGTAIASGACALLLQWNTSTSHNTALFGPTAVSTTLIRGASRDYNRTYPNREWGYGTLNIPGSFESLRPV